MSEEANKREDDYYAGTMKDDYISRKAVLDMLEEECGSCADIGYIFSLSGIEKQPGITLESAIDYLHSIGWMQEHDRTLTESVQPEIIHCESCKHWKNEHICECLSRYGTFETPKNFYCGYGKENR